jgi:hypothetical protein
MTGLGATGMRVSGAGGDRGYPSGPGPELESGLGYGPDETPSRARTDVEKTFPRVGAVRKSGLLRKPAVARCLDRHLMQPLRGPYRGL